MSSTKTSNYYKALENHYSSDDKPTGLKDKAESFRSSIRIKYEESRRSYMVASRSFETAYMDGNLELVLELTERMETIEHQQKNLKTLMEESFNEELPE
jgi:hypothetical protein